MLVAAGMAISPASAGPALVVDDADETEFSKTDWVLVTRDKALPINNLDTQLHLKDGVLALTPLDFEREWSLSEGNIFQGELSLEQLFFLRPAPGWAGYRTPIRKLFMCGSATHPGGGIMGAPGLNAARVILGQ